MRQESYTPLVRFDENLRDQIIRVLGAGGLAGCETGVHARAAVLADLLADGR